MSEREVTILMKMRSWNFFNQSIPPRENNVAMGTLDMKDEHLTVMLT